MITAPPKQLAKTTYHVIIAVDKKNIISRDALVRFLRGKKPEGQLKLNVIRENKNEPLRLPLAKNPVFKYRWV